MKIFKTILTPLLIIPSISFAFDINEFKEEYVVENNNPVIPTVTITHEIRKRGNDRWVSEMSGSAVFNRFSVSERGYFSNINNNIIPTFYTSYYKIPTRNRSFTISGDELKEMPDRQSMFIELSKIVDNKECMEKNCSIEYYDHRERLKTLEFIISKEGKVDYNGQNIDFYLIKGEQDNSEVKISLHPKYPGMLLLMDVEGDYLLVNKKVDRNSIASYF